MAIRQNVLNHLQGGPCDDPMLKVRSLCAFSLTFHWLHFADRVMIAYSNFLLKPAVKVIVLILFAAMFGVMVYSTTQLEQHFDFTEILPEDSYIQTWWDAFNNYNEKNGIRAGIHFRDVDFSQNKTRQEMYCHVQELVDVPHAGRHPTCGFWLLDFDQFALTESVTDLSFDEQLKLFLDVPTFEEAHGDNIVLDESGAMLASRTILAHDNHDCESIKETVDALELQEKISANQPVNRDRKDWAFFAWAEDCCVWEFCKVSPEELTLSTLLGTASVSFLALLFTPHWSAVFIVFFMLAVLCIDLMGFIQFCGVAVGPVMHISMVMSIGLMVDHVMHVTCRHMEIKASSRHEKTKKTPETIGASVMLGGLSTLIGVLPLGLSSSEIFWTVFVVFFGLVLLGLLHGLVLLPVLLSIFGPMVVLEGEANESATEEAEKVSQEKAPQENVPQENDVQPFGIVAVAEC